MGEKVIENGVGGFKRETTHLSLVTLHVFSDLFTLFIYEVCPKSSWTNVIICLFMDGLSSKLIGRFLSLVLLNSLEKYLAGIHHEFHVVIETKIRCPGATQIS